MKTIILIPPSEGKTKEATNSPLQKISTITKIILKDYLPTKKEDQEKFYGVKDKALNEAIEKNKTIRSQKTTPAINRYKGVVYNAIDYNTLHKKDQKQFQEKVRIVSALFGIIKPQENIPDYKVKIEKIPAKKLWLKHNTNIIKDHFIIDLLPKAHKKAVHYKKGIEVEFILIKNKKKIPAGHQGKYIKGRFIRWLIQNNITNPKDFIKFKEENYIWTGEHFLKEI